MLHLVLHKIHGYLFKNITWEFSDLPFKVLNLLSTLQEFYFMGDGEGPTNVKGENVQQRFGVNILKNFQINGMFS